MSKIMVSSLQYPIVDYKLSDMLDDFKICSQDLKNLGLQAEIQNPELDLTHYIQQSQLLLDLINTGYGALSKHSVDHKGSMFELSLRLHDLRRSCSFLIHSDRLETILARLNLNYDRTLMEINRLDYLNEDQLDIITFKGFDINHQSIYQQYSGIANLSKLELPEIVHFQITEIIFGTFQGKSVISCASQENNDLLIFLHKHRKQLSKATLIFKQKIEDTPVLEDFTNTLDQAKILYEMTNYKFAYFKFDLSLLSLRCQHAEKPENQCLCGYESFSEYLNRI